MGFVVKEMFVGALIGYAFSMLLWVMTAIGELMDVQSGFTNAQIFDPFGNHPKGPLFCAHESGRGAVFRRIRGASGFHTAFVRLIRTLASCFFYTIPINCTPRFRVGTSGSF